MTHRQSMKETYKNIREAFTKILEEHDDLSEIKSVTYGRKSELGRLRSPSIWIIPESYEPELAGSKTENHDFTFLFVVLVRSDKAEEGFERAQDLSMTVYDVLTEDRSLNGTAHDVRPLQVDPAYAGGEENPQLYWSAVEFAFRVKRR